MEKALNENERGHGEQQSGEKKETEARRKEGKDTLESKR